MQRARIAVSGAGGRMGRNLIRAIAENENTDLAGAWERDGSEHVGADCGVLAGLQANGIEVSPSMPDALTGADVALDFTVPAASLATARHAADAGIAVVIGTTGFSVDEDRAIAECATRSPIVKSGNMSMGVILLSVLVEQAARALEAADWDLEVLEMHHRHKVDAPSGTALLLGEAAARGRGIDLAENSVRVRDGHTGARSEGTIGFATLRGGTVVGDHSVVIAGSGEQLTLSHHAADRTIFARGALRAALWAHGRAPGLYSMHDVLGLKKDT